MRYMKGKIHFNKKELASLSEENPTLFELAQRYSKEAHLCADVYSHEDTGWVNVKTNLPDSNNNELRCPSQVFFVSDATLVDGESGDPACSKMRCWNMRNDPDGKLPCWFRTWNEFVSDMRSIPCYDFDKQ